jgi:hypothetical protein
MMHRSTVFGLTLLAGLATLGTGRPALAAPAAADLTVSIAAPTGVYVYDTGRYQVAVSNIGRKNASSVRLSVALPSTHTSPQVHVLGTLGAYDGRCSRSGTDLVCLLGGLARGASTTVFFDIALPQSAAPLVVEARVSSSSAESSTSNNLDSETASLLHPALAVVGPVDALNQHCTGTGLTSFFECALFPSSISSHEIRFEAGGSITFLNPPAPGYTGTWSQPAADRLTFTYSDGSGPVASFDGYAVDGDCFEGLTIFFPASPYVSPYSVCLQ